MWHREIWRDERIQSDTTGECGLDGWRRDAHVWGKNPEGFLDWNKDPDIIYFANGCLNWAARMGESTQYRLDWRNKKRKNCVESKNTDNREINKKCKYDWSSELVRYAVKRERRLLKDEWPLFVQGWWRWGSCHVTPYTVPKLIIAITIIINLIWIKSTGHRPPQFDERSQRSQ